VPARLWRNPIIGQEIFGFLIEFDTVWIVAYDRHFHVVIEHLLRHVVEVGERIHMALHESCQRHIGREPNISHP